MVDLQAAHEWVYECHQELQYNIAYLESYAMQLLRGVDSVGSLTVTRCRGSTPQETS